MPDNDKPPPQPTPTKPPGSYAAAPLTASDRPGTGSPATNPAPVQRQSTRPDAYGIDDAPLRKVCPKCGGNMVPQEGIEGEHSGWHCRACEREPPAAKA